MDTTKFDFMMGCGNCTNFKSSDDEFKDICNNCNSKISKWVLSKQAYHVILSQALKSIQMTQFGNDRLDIKKDMQLKGDLLIVEAILDNYIKKFSSPATESDNEA